MVGKLTIGVLAMQGAVAKHLAMLRNLSVKAVEVRSNEQLNACDGLIIPGGESTTIYGQLTRHHMQDSLIKFAETRPLFGTCAGMILMVKLGLLDIKVERNGFGRQIHSFIAPLLFNGKEIEGFFIRAPRIVERSPQAKSLILHKNEPVCVQQHYHLACSFHPELTNDTSIHKYFIQLCSQVNNSRLKAKAFS